MALSVWATMMLPAFIVAVGLGVDFAGHSAAEQEARAVARQAARAATHEVVISVDEVRLDAPKARSAAISFAAASGYPATVTISQGIRADVVIESAYDTVFLGLIGIHEIGFEVDATARVAATVDGSEA